MRSNEDSGFKWGPFNLQGPRPWILKTEAWGGSVKYPYSRPKISQQITDVDLTQPIIHKGNDFACFTHFRDYPSDTQVYFWDNCLLPQFMQTSGANPTGTKTWTRIVYKSQFPGRFTGTERDLQLNEQRVNREIQRQGQGTWQDTVKRPWLKTSKTRCLLALPSEECLIHYYQQTLDDLVKAVTTQCESLGYDLVIRPKVDRRRRSQNTLEDQCRAENISVVIGVHSAVAHEAVNLGMAYVALGQHPLALIATSWREFTRGEILWPTEEAVDQRTRELLLTVYSKHELLEGTWSLSPGCELLEPITTWRLL